MVEGAEDGLDGGQQVLAGGELLQGLGRIAELLHATPAIVAPIEFTMRLEDYRELGGHMDSVRRLEEVTGSLSRSDAAAVDAAITALEAALAEVRLRQA